ncbi:winged helix-turn-helix domain-containing protein [Pseudoalteromonas peptidolytica]|uniref:winged helix-turn-helix domain-containing protein n=1 Tax=Pseudoalteromonas peptidolytica TaxID=61150 RepID=UPI00298EB2E9|nr:winged helix-turn-helix domain-containing protein [Pseudoalteromonas peptidolytica]MDW7547981.1 winged helix-turn-helix domain-containing protein [Pseudoalteromonas peptidolytica]
MELKQFLIADHLVDVSRNHIVIDQQAYTLPPKAIAVLCELAKQPGEVVSFEQLLNTVWHNRVVSLNTLQRCIFQVRQVFKYADRDLEFIKTHSKKGYSLEVPVTSIANKPVARKVVRKNRTRAAKFAVAALMVLIVAFTSTFIAKLKLSPQIPSQPHFTPITTSDAWDANASYSPDGKWIAFQRFSDNCHSQLWVKNLTSHKEFRLTAIQGVYGKPSWSPDTKRLTFTERSHCKAQQSSPFCWSLNTLEFETALNTPQTPRTVIACKEKPMWRANWMKNGEISYLSHLRPQQTVLSLFNPKENINNTINHIQKGKSYTLDYLASKNIFALVSIDEHNSHHLTIYSPDKATTSTAKIALPYELSPLQPIDISFHPSGEYLLASTTNGLYRLETSGKMVTLDTGGRKNLRGAAFSADGRHILATQIHADTDIFTLSLAQIRNHQTAITKKVARTIMGEDNPQFQPHGDHIAFTSTRTGSRQIWLYNSQSVSQLTNSQHDNISKRIAWSPTGNEIAGTTQKGLTLWSLEGEKTFISNSLAIDSVMQWLTPTTLLVTARENGQAGLYIINKDTKEASLVVSENVVWAAQVDDGHFIYQDMSKRFWFINLNISPFPTELRELRDQLAQPFAVYNDGILYGVNNNNQLWSYHLNKKIYQRLTTIPSNSRYLADFNGETFLFTQMHLLQKNIVSLNMPDAQN